MKFDYYKFALVSILFAIIIGALYSAPQFFIRNFLENNLKVDFVTRPFISMADGGDAYFQFARNFSVGNFPSGDLFFNNSKPNVYPLLPPVFLGSLIKLTSGNVSSAYILANFIFPAVLFLIFVITGLAVFRKDKLFSVLFGIVGVLTPISLLTDRAFFNLDNFLNIFLKNFYPGVHTYIPILFFSRVDYPLLTSVIYLLAIFFLIKYWLNPSNLLAIISGIFCGLLFYTYFHKWVFVTIFIGVLLFLSILFKERGRFKSNLILLFSFGLTSIPYFFTYFKLKKVDGYQDLINRLYLEVGRQVNFSAWKNYVVYAVVFILIYFVFYGKNKSKFIFYTSVIISSFIVWNIQVIIGYVPHSDHWPRAINPFLFMIISDIFYTSYRKYSDKTIRSFKIEKIFIFLVIFVLIPFLFLKKVINFTGFIKPNLNVASEFTLPKDILDSYGWLEKHGNGRAVFSDSFVTSIYLTGFSSSKPNLPWGGAALIPNYEMEEYFIKSNKLFSVPEDVFEKRLRNGKGLLCRENCSSHYIDENIFGARSYLYQLYYKNVISEGNKDIPDTKISELVSRYKSADINFDYIGSGLVYSGPFEKVFSDPKFISDKRLELVFKNSSTEIYKIIK